LIIIFSLGFFPFCIPRALKEKEKINKTNNNQGDTKGVVEPPSSPRPWDRIKAVVPHDALLHCRFLKPLEFFYIRCLSDGFLPSLFFT